MNRTKLDKIKKVLCLLLAVLMVAGVLASSLLIPSYAAEKTNYKTSENLEERILILSNSIYVKDSSGNYIDVGENSIEKDKKYKVEILMEIAPSDGIAEDTIHVHNKSGAFDFGSPTINSKGNGNSQLGGNQYQLVFENVNYSGFGNSQDFIITYKRAGKSVFHNETVTFDNYKFSGSGSGGSGDSGNSSTPGENEKPKDAIVTYREIRDRYGRDVKTVNYGGRYNVTIHVEVVGKNNIENMPSAAISGGSFKVTDEPDSRVLVDYSNSSLSNSTGYIVELRNVMYTGKGNSTSVKMWYESGSTLGIHEFTVTFDEYRFNEYKAPSGGDTEEKDPAPLTPGIYVKTYNVMGLNGKQAEGGDKVTLEVVFENSSNEFDLENIIMTLDTGTDFYLENASNLFRKDIVRQGGTFKYKVDLKVKNNIQPQAHTVKFDFKYQYMSNNGTRVEGTSTETVAIPLKEGEGGGDDGKNPLVPHVIISQYDYGNKSVTAGDTVTLSVSCLNTSNQYDIENIVMKITPSDALSIASSSNSFYIEKLAKNSAFTKSFDIQVKADALSKSHDVAISFDFQYIANGTRMTGKSEETIAIPVVQIDRFSIQKTEIPSQLWQGDEIPVSINLINKGKSVVSNVTIEFVTDDESIKESQYIGNVESGKEASGDFFVTAKQAGQMNGKFIVSYEDSNMNIKTLERDFSIEIHGMEIDNSNVEPEINPDEINRQNELMAMAEKERKNKELVRNIILITCGLVMAGISGYITVSKIKMQRSEESDEDL